MDYNTRNSYGLKYSTGHYRFKLKFLPWAYLMPIHLCSLIPQT